MKKTFNRIIIIVAVMMFMFTGLGTNVLAYDLDRVDIKIEEINNQTIITVVDNLGNKSISIVDNKTKSIMQDNKKVEFN